jgi:hypothetical protein
VEVSDHQRWSQVTHSNSETPLLSSIKLGTIFFLFYFYQIHQGIQWVTRRVSLGKKNPTLVGISVLKVKFQASCSSQNCVLTYVLLTYVSCVFLLSKLDFAEPLSSRSSRGAASAAAVVHAHQDTCNGIRRIFFKPIFG